LSARILIVEDDMLIAMDLQATLEDLGYHVVLCVPTGEEAIQKTEECFPDLIIMDVRLAGRMDGISAAKVIKANYNIPVVFVTASTKADFNDLRAADESWECIGKPFRDEQLQAAVVTALEKAARSKP